jgi:hypothetical protein
VLVVLVVTVVIAVDAAGAMLEGRVRRWAG